MIGRKSTCHKTFFWWKMFVFKGLCIWVCGRLQTAILCEARVGERTMAARQTLARLSALQTAGAQVWHTPKRCATLSNAQPVWFHEVAGGGTPTEPCSLYGAFSYRALAPMEPGCCCFFWRLQIAFFGETQVMCHTLAARQA